MCANTLASLLGGGLLRRRLASARLRVARVAGRGFAAAARSPSSGTTPAASAVLGAWLAFGGRALLGDRFAARQDVAREGRLSEFCSVWYLEMLTEEIENSTMNSAISSVIMSA